MSNDYRTSLAAWGIAPYFVSSNGAFYVVRLWSSAGRSAIVGEYGYRTQAAAQAKADKLNARYGL